jgi:hypothetical protein
MSVTKIMIAPCCYSYIKPELESCPKCKKKLKWEINRYYCDQDNYRYVVGLSEDKLSTWLVGDYVNNPFEAALFRNYEEALTALTGNEKIFKIDFTVREYKE